MLMVEELVFGVADPGFGSTPTMRSKTAKNTFLHDLVDIGTKKYFILLYLKHNKFCAVSNSLITWSNSAMLKAQVQVGDRQVTPTRG